MQFMKRDWEKLSNKASTNQSELISNLDQLISHLELLRENNGNLEHTQTELESILSQSKLISKSALQSHKEYHSLCSKWQKMIDKRFSQTVLPLLGTQATLNSDPSLSANDDPKLKRPFESYSARSALDRVIANHLIRQGRFETAKILLKECGHSIPKEHIASCESLYQILDCIRSGDLAPAIQWAEEHREWLEERGSPLAFDLRRSEFVHLLTDDDLKVKEEANGFNSINAQQRALAYASEHFRRFISTRWDEAVKLTSSVLYAPLSNLRKSPYSEFYQSAQTGSLVPWVHAHHLIPLFTQEFYAALRWSKELPLVVATDLGSGGALAKIAKVRSVMKEKRTEWSQADELPVEIPLPAEYRFHSVFACPVSKEQSTEINPPMMMPCGHVIAQESMKKLAKGGGTVKCPYCPSSASMTTAMEVYF
ncbi:uncharacterized protein MELLADRAFT_45698 [Melampsora larici-populina 98AG31]|uniref:GID complex catalytic subunit 2 n=1 Tax=Melampsora larici-populina (strain 98AG31 / pathotype 3-4-7) TaxID=747676 RepID=F4S6X1_MELLP|nr:uncharacterized protein MELLADRAFT_45698 [Melampsora larici-populina 98AG31]EGF99650.1 hypothetical protein MELLADRAFT_45698 [Melampsora larici-populina 98AG31]